MSEMMLPPELTSDAELVAASLAGDRNAFGRIVERYQRLLCSLAYSGTGNLSESEDVAQEAFVEAWRQLRKLREPEKLRSWLCGILRHKVSRLRRSDHREPVRGAESMDAAGELNSDDEPVADQTMREEEQTMMWNALARVPEIYREPLVLYYREHRSVEHVAAALDLSEDAVKQRLSRGRKVLQEQVMAFVEGALVRSTPGKVFTVGVLAMLPAMVPTTAKAAGVGAAAVKGGMLAKTTGLATLVASLAGVFSAIMSLRVALDQSRTQRERRAVVRTTIGVIGGVFAPLVVLYAMRAGAYRWPAGGEVLAWSAQGAVLLFMVIWPWAFVRVLRDQRALRSAERRRQPERFEHEADRVGATAGEYRSRATLCGVPLVHVRFAQADEGARPVCGWIAGGDRAFGLLLAWGAVAVAPISIGALSAGIVSVGSLGFGVVSLGTVTVGLLSVGCVAVGVKAYAWLSALGWESAQSGGFAIARHAAEGPVALAEHANSAIARQMLANPQAERDHMIFLIVIAICAVVPTAIYANVVRRRLGRGRMMNEE